jgi:ADP-heptose:LPS heptosyltransferase
MRIRHQTIRKILVIQLQPFGDVFLTTAYFKALKAYYPKGRLYYLVKAPYQNIVRDHPFIDELIVIPKKSGLRYLIERLKTFRRLRREGFDLVIDQQNMPSSQILAFITGAPYRIGYADERNNLNFLYNIHARFGTPRYSAAQKFDIVKPIGMPEASPVLHFDIPQEALDFTDTWLKAQGVIADKAILMAPGSKLPHKKWASEGYAQVAAAFQAKGYHVILICAPGEEKDIEAVTRHMTSPPCILPPTALDNVAALISRIPFFICNDGGINHLAVAVGNKTLALFGRTSPQAWSPATQYPSHRHLFNPDAAKDDPFFGINPDEVVSAIMDFLETPP